MINLRKIRLARLLDFYPCATQTAAEAAAAESLRAKQREVELQDRLNNLQTSHTLELREERKNVETIEREKQLIEQQLDNLAKELENIREEKINIEAEVRNKNVQITALLEDGRQEREEWGRQVQTGAVEAARLQDQLQILQSQLQAAETGLQELGRENQTLQLELQVNSKLSGGDELAVQAGRSNWVEDGAVRECAACGVQFGVRQRRHHCR